MRCFRNLLFFVLFAVTVVSCGGGTNQLSSNTVADSPADNSGNTGSVPDTGGTTDTGGNANTGGTTDTGGGTNTGDNTGTGGTTNTDGNTSGGTTGGTTNSLLLKWSAPTTRADGTAVSLSEISGYRLYYDPSATDTPSYVNITDGSATQYTMTLPTGTYYFRICAIDSSGFEGLKSDALQKMF